MSGSVYNDVSKALEGNSYYSSNESADETINVRPQPSISNLDDESDTERISIASGSQADAAEGPLLTQEQKDAIMHIKYKTEVHEPSRGPINFEDDERKVLRSMNEVEKMIKLLGGKMAH